MTNPYLIQGPALISFSGGRTSGYMLKQILDAHGGTLPDDVHVCFANTGKEREEALRFVHECESRWGVQIIWLEWRSRLKRSPLAERFEIVGFNSAAREGEPFKALIASKKAVPNAVHRWCTEHLKMQVLANFMEAQGYEHWTNVVGLRADELRRAAKKEVQNETGQFPWTSVMPMVKAHITKADIRRFWFGDMKPVDAVQIQRDFGPIAATTLPQGFDLGLDEWEGNCSKCFLKAKALLIHDVRRDLDDARDWAAMEALGGGRFVTEYSMLDLIAQAASSPLLPLGDDFAEFDAECGVGGTDTAIRCGAPSSSPL
jgi:3'-phosphoadenosine 5'-phosphosulfate sulfotransferase (PAPS reductase)/FAD synthetase